MAAVEMLKTIVDEPADTGCHQGMVGRVDDESGAAIRERDLITNDAVTAAALRLWRVVVVTGLTRLVPPEVLEAVRHKLDMADGVPDVPMAEVLVGRPRSRPHTSSPGRRRSMLQLLDLARENAALKCELARIRGEAEALKRRLVEVRQMLATRSCSQRASSVPATHCVGTRVDAMLAEALDPGR
jgi:hypothetical protein